MQGARRRHYKQVAQIAVPPHAAHLRKGKALDRSVLIAVTRAVVTARNGIGAHLHHAERCGRTREGLAQTVIYPRRTGARTRTDERVYVLRHIRLHRSAGRSARHEGRSRQSGRKRPHGVVQTTVHVMYDFSITILHFTDGRHQPPAHSANIRNITQTWQPQAAFKAAARTYSRGPAPRQNFIHRDYSFLSISSYLC